MDTQLKQLLLERIAKIENELQSLRSILSASDVQDVYVDEDCIDVDIIDDVNETPDQILQRLFTIVRSKQSSEERQKSVLPLLHSSISAHSPAVDSFFRFSFKTFQERWEEYLDQERQSDSFQIERRKENHRGELHEIKLYLISPYRSPSPITFRQDPAQHLSWRIQSLSL